jgi:hypothetical protein
MLPTLQPRVAARTVKTTLEAELEEARSAMTRSGMWRKRSGGRDVRCEYRATGGVVTVFSVF